MLDDDHAHPTVPGVAATLILKWEAHVSSSHTSFNASVVLAADPLGLVVRAGRVPGSACRRRRRGTGSQSADRPEAPHAPQPRAEAIPRCGGWSTSERPLSRRPGRPGPLGGDLIIGAHGFGPRSSRSSSAGPASHCWLTCRPITLPPRFAAAVGACLRRLPAKADTLTWGQGTEMANHAQLAIDADVLIYFCDRPRRGIGPPTRIAAGRYVNTSPRALTCRSAAPDISPSSPTNSTTGPAGSWADAPPERSSMTPCV